MILKLSKNTVILYYTIFTIFAHCVRPKCWLKNESLGILQSSSIKVHQTLFECNIESSIMRFLVQTSNFVSKLITCTLFIWMLAGENPKIKVVSKIRIVKMKLNLKNWKVAGVQNKVFSYRLVLANCY